MQLTERIIPGSSGGATYVRMVPSLHQMTGLYLGAIEPVTPPAQGSDLPPASELVAEIEQFLRQQRPE